MSAHVEESYSAFCPDCDWESEYWEERSPAEQAAERHNKSHHGEAEE